MWPNLRPAHVANTTCAQEGFGFKRCATLNNTEVGIKVAMNDLAFSLFSFNALKYLKLTSNNIFCKMSLKKISPNTPRTAASSGVS